MTKTKKEKPKARVNDTEITVLTETKYPEGKPIAVGESFMTDKVTAREWCRCGWAKPTGEDEPEPTTKEAPVGDPNKPGQDASAAPKETR